MPKQRRSARKRSRPAKSKFKSFDFLYLMERTTEKEWWSLLTFQAEVKIGVTNRQPAKRQEEIDEDLPGQVILQQFIHIPGRAKIYEDRLLRKWDKRVNPSNAGESAGRTEWRRVTWLEYCFLLFDYWLIRHRNTIAFFKFVIFILLTILTYLYYEY